MELCSILKWAFPKKNGVGKLFSIILTTGQNQPWHKASNSKQIVCLYKGSNLILRKHDEEHKKRFSKIKWLKRSNLFQSVVI